MAISVSVALIVRNEERLLERCLESLRGAVDEIVIVDTGSEDGNFPPFGVRRARDGHCYQRGGWPPQPLCMQYRDGRAAFVPASSAAIDSLSPVK